MQIEKHNMLIYPDYNILLVLDLWDMPIMLIIKMRGKSL